MIDDSRHLTLFDSYQREIYDTLAQFRAQTNGLDDKATLISVYIAQNEALREVLRKQHRAFRWMRGEKVEQENHEVEAVLEGMGGLTY